MTDFTTADFNQYDPRRTDEHKVLRDEVLVPCRMCWDIFGRVRLTLRFCGSCKRAFCEGEHGNFSGGGRAVCVRCFIRSGSQLGPDEPSSG